ncbi:MAG: molybdate ABC transporter substrate-binding protein [Elainellaceae cyanobacterium]
MKLRRLSQRPETCGAIALALAAALGTLACTASATDDALTISAAASTQDAMQAIAAAYRAEAPEVTITYNFGASGSLAQQIAQGAPVDVFLSASSQWMQVLEAQGRVGPSQGLLQNSIVLAVPLTQAGVASFADLITLDKVAIGEPESVPAGRYAKEVLTALALWDDLTPRLVFGKSVRQVLAYVETGNVDAGLVYRTDLLVSKRVKAIATAPAESHSPIVYPVATVEEGRAPEAAQDFVDFLFTDAAEDVFRTYGFEVVTTESRD